MTQADLDAIRKRAEAATPGPWRAECAGIEGDAYVAATGPWKLMPYFGPYVNNDFEFIAHARQDIPALLDALEAARREIETLKYRLSRYPAETGGGPSSSRDAG